MPAALPYTQTSAGQRDLILMMDTLAAACCFRGITPADLAKRSGLFDRNSWQRQWHCKRVLNASHLARYFRAAGLVVVPIEAVQGVPMPIGADGRPWELPDYAPLPPPDPKRWSKPAKPVKLAAVGEDLLKYDIPATDAGREHWRQHNADWAKRCNLDPPD